MQRQGGKVQNLGGEPFVFIGATNARKATVHLDLRAYHDPPPHHVVGYAPAISILSLRRRAGRFASSGRLKLFTSKRIQVKKHSSSLAGPRSSRVGPSMVSMAVPRHPYDKGWARDRPKLRRTSFTGVSAHDRVAAGLTLAQSP